MLTRLSPARSDDAATFYESRVGRRAATLLNRRLDILMPDISARRLLGVGYTLPYLERNTTMTISARLNTPQTHTRSDLTRNLPDCLIDSARMPFDDLSMDVILVMHGLEFARSVPDFLRSLWRVLTDDGLLVLVAPNRAGAWAHFDTTPFGHGSPFSTRQLGRLLEAGLFRIETHTGALMTPPGFSTNLGGGYLIERLSGRVRLPMAGVHIVTARKNAYAGLPLTPVPVRLHMRNAATEPA